MSWSRYAGSHELWPTLCAGADSHGKARAQRYHAISARDAPSKTSRSCRADSATTTNTMNLKLHAGLASYGEITTTGPVLLALVRSAYERFIEPLEIAQPKATIHATDLGQARGNNMPLNDIGWANVADRFVRRDTEFFSAFKCTDPRRVIEEWAEHVEGEVRITRVRHYPGRAALLNIVIDEAALPDSRVSLEWQGRLTDFVTDAFIALLARTAFATFDRSFTDTMTPYEYPLRIFGVAEDQARGYFWGNWLSPLLVTRLGGIEVVLRDAPCFAAKSIPRSDGMGAYLQLTEDLMDFDDASLRKLRDFLKPILPRSDAKVPAPAPGRDRWRLIYDEE